MWYPVDTPERERIPGFRAEFGMGYVIAVDLGATNTRIARVEDGGTVIGEIVTIPTPQEGEFPQVITDHLIAAVRAKIPAPSAALEGIGIGVAGPVDYLRGSVVNPPNIPCAEIPVVDPMEDAFGVPVRLANDCITGIIGEACFGAARGFRNAVYITLSTGIGAGILAGGRLLLGSNGNAGEVGHFPVDSTYNVRCGCGYSGHWEGFASGRHLAGFFGIWHAGRQREPPHFPASTAAEIFTAAQNGDPLAREFVDTVGQINARGISAVIVAYDPEVIVLDGAIVLGNPTLILPAIERFADRFLPMPRLRITALEGRAPLLGASVIAHGYESPFGSLLDRAGRAEPPV